MDHALIARLRADLTAAHYTVDRLEALWGPEAEAALERGDRVPARRALAGHRADPAATLATAFVLGLPIAESDLAAALPSLGSTGARELGMVDAAGRPTVDLRPYAFLDAHGAGSWWIASDPGELATGGALRTDHVLGVGGASATLAGLQLPDPVEATLDLGTGCGIQAMHAARRSRRVVATDISERALDYARLNAALNGVTNIEFRLGSLYEPVAGERFDRIVSNPPFVITPRRPDVPAYEYRDGGLVGDGIVEAVIAGARDHLVPGGVAQLLGNWEQRPGPSGRPSGGLARATRWADDAGLESWIVERETQDPARYAETWIRDGGTRASDPGYEDLVAAWLDDFAERRVTAVGFGYVLLRHPVGSARLHRAERLDAPLGSGAAGLGGHLAAALAAFDAAAALDDEALLAARLRVAADVTEERSHWPGAADPSIIVLRQGGGFRREIRADTGLAAVVGACDGELPAGVIVGAVAQLLEVDPAALRAELVPQLRELLVGGLLTFA
ncbi:class I SAM-dependent methyltransferase [Pseudolysinimonas sp.]|uniref:class I SAM-dependent methyltransferase n=1 Tax=Pseudolysinimonas sp. TaxID=2680009 RepID=UPI003F7F486E